MSNLIHLIEVDRLKENPKNPRTIKDDKFLSLVKSIKDFPQMLNLRPLIITPDNIVLGGNMRLRACKEAGLIEVPVIYADDLSEAQQKEFIIKDNISFGEWDWDILQNDWDMKLIGEWGADIPEFLFPANDIEEDDFVIPADVETDIAIGDLFEIAGHRLLCGSAINKSDVDKVLSDSRPYLMVTDPPYGVRYDPDWRNKAKRRDGTTIGAFATKKVNNDDSADWSEAWKLSPSSVAYVWHSGINSSIVQTSIERAGYEVRSQIIWEKNFSIISRGSYHWQHEPCFYGVRKGCKSNFIGGRKQSTIWTIDKPNKSETGHSAQKPVECMARPIRNHLSDIVYDPFIGSGTTLIAAHHLGRACFGIDIDPKCIQVCIDRIRNFDPSVQIKKNGNAL